MAYNNNYQRPQQPRYNAAPSQPVEIRALPLPEDYVDEAEKVIQSLDPRRAITTMTSMTAVAINKPL